MFTQGVNVNLPPLFDWEKIDFLNFYFNQCAPDDNHFHFILGTAQSDTCHLIRLFEWN